MREPLLGERSSRGLSSSGRHRQAGGFWGGLLLLGGSQAALLLAFDLSVHPWLLVACAASGFLGLWAVDRSLARAGAGSVDGAVVGTAWRGRAAPDARFILGVAVLLRLLALPLPPTLSDDVLRYVWDGRVLAAGLNPYRWEPEAAPLKPLRGDLWEQLPHRDVATVYPPLALAVFSIAAHLPLPVLVLKLLLTVADLAACAALLVLARRIGLPLERTLWYAWNPLVVLETAGMGHVDALGVAAMVLAVLALVTRPRRPSLAATAGAAGVLSKLVPLVLLPMWARQSGRPVRFAVIAAALLVAALLPVVVSTGGAPPGLVRYGVSWEFNGPLHEPLWRLLERIDLQGHVETGLDRLKVMTGWHEFWNLFYPFNYPQLEAKVLLAGILLAGLIWLWRAAEPVSGSGRLMAIVLLTSATLYPWYVLWALPWAALCRQPAWLALSGLVLVSYVPQFLGQPLFPWYFVAIWGPFWLLLWLHPRWSTS